MGCERREGGGEVGRGWRGNGKGGGEEGGCSGEGGGGWRRVEGEVGGEVDEAFMLFRGGERFGEGGSAPCPSTLAARKEVEQKRRTHNKPLIPSDPLPITMPKRTRHLRQLARKNVRRFILKKGKRVIRMSHFIAGVVDGRESVEETLDVGFGREGAGTDPGETGVEGRF